MKYCDFRVNKNDNFTSEIAIFIFTLTIFRAGTIFFRILYGVMSLCFISLTDC